MADDADRAADWQEREQALALARHYAHTPTALGTPLTDRAGHRLCLNCGLPIAPARLAVLPGAIRCRDCQSAQEAL